MKLVFKILTAVCLNDKEALTVEQEPLDYYKSKFLEAGYFNLGYKT